MGQLTHGSLFSGIGGIELGLEWAGFDTAWQVENNDFCNKVLAKRWPAVQRFLDVKDVGKHNLKPVDLISGGFPCQDLSIAAGGKKRGLHNRSGLWYEYARIVSELRPNWVLVENVPHLFNFGADIVISDLEEQGYACWTSVVGADNFDAPFERQRVFILAGHKSHCMRDIGADMGRFTLSEDTRRAVAQASEDWKNWQHELASGDASPRRDSEESEADAYARGVRAVHGIPGWVDRLRAIGNACTPVIPAIIGNWIVNYEHHRHSGR